MPNFFSKLFGKGRSSPPMAARCDTCAKLESVACPYYPPTANNQKCIACDSYVLIGFGTYYRPGLSGDAPVYSTLSCPVCGSTEKELAYSNRFQCKNCRKIYT